MNLHVKVRGPYLLDGRETLNPGSVVSLAEDTAKDMIRRGMAEPHPGPASKAPAPDHRHGTRADGRPVEHRSFAPPEPERADIAGKLARAERATAAPQAAGR